MRMLHIVSEAQFKLKEAHQPKIQFEITLLKLIHMERTQKLNALLDELNELKKNFSNQPEVTKIDSANNQKTDSAGETPKSPIKSETAKKPDTPNGASESSPATKKEQSKAESSSSHTNKPPKRTSSPPQKEKVTPSPSQPAQQPQSSAKTQQVVTREQPVSQQSADDEFDNLFGASSLGSKKPSAKAETSNGAAQKKEQEKSSQQQKEKRAPKDVTLDEIEQCWEEYLQNLRQHVPEMLYFQMQRVDPTELKNGELELRCSDDFAKKIVDENKRRLGKFLEDEIGAFLNFKSFVKKQETNKQESMSPYERFKRLQERDPTIKKLVELFGAELDYNLNQ
jgi:DNA polymerase-3 subunit gamma/tau